MLLTAACVHAPAVAEDNSLFPSDLVDFQPYEKNPVFVAEGPGHWDARIRERGWILREGNAYWMWFTGYDGTRAGRKMLGFATSSDGLRWTRSAANPLDRDNWIEDMMVVKQGETFLMFAEGKDDRAQLLTSADGLRWERRGQLDVRKVDRTPIDPGPFGTPTAWLEDDTWYLFYERGDRGVWLASSRDMRVWRNVQDEPVLLPGPAAWEKDRIAVNQIIKYNGRYYAYYHGAAVDANPVIWSTNVASSADLVHWEKYAGNPLLPAEANKSSGIVVHDGRQFRLYTMHDEVHVHFPRKRPPAP
jgi:hypothetical protein